MLSSKSTNQGAFIEEFIIPASQSGILNGLNFAVKDCIDIKGKLTGFGNPTWQKTHPPAIENAICVELLLLNGAKCLGKTITDEFTYSLIGENYFYGTPLNPHCPDRVPGGSSSGSASSVSCGIVDFALGTDTGGSVRVPASNCGIYGYRPTHGKIITAGTIPLAPSLDTIGVLSKNFSILKNVASVLLGNDFKINSKPKVIVIEDILDICEPTIKQTFLTYLNKSFEKYSFLKLTDILSSEITFSWLFELYVLLHSCELWNVHGSWIESTKPELGPIANYNFNQIAKIANRNNLPSGIRKREWFADIIRNYLNDKVIFCFPTTPDIAPKKDFHSQNPEARKSGGYFQKLIGINAIASLSRSPQITIPINKSGDFPVGMSFLASQNQDGLLFQLLSGLFNQNEN